MAPPDADDASAPRPTSGPINFLSDIYSRLTSPSDPSPPPNSRFSSDGTAKPTLASRDDESTEKSAKKPLYKRKWFIIMNIVVALLCIVVLFIVLYPVAHAIAQYIINATVLNVDQAIITNPTNQS